MSEDIIITFVIIITVAWFALGNYKVVSDVISPGIEPGSRASEALILSVVLRDQKFIAKLSNKKKL